MQARLLSIIAPFLPNRAPYPQRRSRCRLEPVLGGSHGLRQSDRSTEVLPLFMQLAFSFVVNPLSGFFQRKWFGLFAIVSHRKFVQP